MNIVTNFRFLKKLVTGERRQQMMFCKVPGAMLTGYELSTDRGVTISQCLSLCTAQYGCYSVNYILSNTTCTLNNATDVGNSANIIKNLPTDYLYFTSRECVK